jgi:ubiquinone/menaquinone biosynthesis C-methylase UbiE
MIDQDAAAARVAAVYNAASDRYTAPPLGFWDRFGAETVRRMGLRPGAHVLDLCCGAGASALAAARVVGPSGQVLALDLSPRLLELATRRAAHEGLDNVEFRCADATATGLPSESFDAVVCVFGVFFAADRSGFVAEMWRHLGPGGAFAVTTWGPHLFEPGNRLFWQEVGRLRPDLDRAFNPWDDLVTSDALGSLLRSVGIEHVVVTAERGTHRLQTADDFWQIVLGSGYRGTVDALTPEQVDVVRDAVLSELRRRGVLAVTTNVVYSNATRPHETRARSLH